MEKEKVYFVQLVDVWNIFYYCGVFKSLESATEYIKKNYSFISGVKDLELKERAGTEGAVFDQVPIEPETEDEYDDECWEVRGYILYQDDLKAV